MTWPLAPHSVVVLLAAVPTYDKLPAAWLRCLSDAEQQRAAAFMVRQRQGEFILARYLLRAVLAHVLGKHPRELDISIDANGRPRLASNGEFRFNISHSQGKVAVALVHGDCNLGVDIEYSTPARSWQAAAPLTLSASEMAYLETLPRHEQNTAFLRLWTRKEALIKATGSGLSSGLVHIDAHPDRATCNVNGMLYRWHEAQFPDGGIGCACIPESCAKPSWIHVNSSTAQSIQSLLHPF